MKMVTPAGSFSAMPSSANAPDREASTASSMRDRTRRSDGSSEDMREHAFYVVGKGASREVERDCPLHHCPGSVGRDVVLEFGHARIDAGYRHGVSRIRIDLARSRAAK